MRDYDMKPGPFQWVESWWFIGGLFAASVVFLLSAAGVFK